MPPFPVAETNGTISLYKNLAYLLRFVKRFLLFSNHNLTILRKTRNSVLDKVSHSILSQPIHIVFFLYLLQCFGTCSIHISIFCIFEFDYNSLIFFIKRFYRRSVVAMLSMSSNSMFSPPMAQMKV